LEGQAVEEAQEIWLPSCLLAVLKEVHTLFDTPPFKRWNLILLP
jgi:hypothetical protein